MLYWIGSNITETLNAVSNFVCLFFHSFGVGSQLFCFCFLQEHVPYGFLSVTFFVLVFLTATQDIAVDGKRSQFVSEQEQPNIMLM